MDPITAAQLLERCSQGGVLGELPRIPSQVAVMAGIIGHREDFLAGHPALDASGDEQHLVEEGWATASSGAAVCVQPDALALFEGQRGVHQTDRNLSGQPETGTVGIQTGHDSMHALDDNKSVVGPSFGVYRGRKADDGLLVRGPATALPEVLSGACNRSRGRLPRTNRVISPNEVDGEQVLCGALAELLPDFLGDDVHIQRRTPVSRVSHGGRQVRGRTDARSNRDRSWSWRRPKQGRIGEEP